MLSKDYYKELEKYLKNGKVHVWKEQFAILKSKRVYPDAFANIIDKNEITVIIDQSKYSEKDVIEAEKNWRVLTFDMTLPFELVGFLSKVSKALADENISIFVVSAYSTDHILIKEKDLAKTKKILEGFGCIIEAKK